MYNPQDFQFNNVGASNPTGVAMQNMGSTALTPPVGVSNTVGINGVAAGLGRGGINLPQAATPFGMNLGTGQLILGGVQALGNLWAAFQAQKLAKEQFNFQKGVTNTNLANQIQSYNTSLADRINARAFTEGRSEVYAEQYIDKNKMRDTRN
jgi:hypothetical protein